MSNVWEEREYHRPKMCSSVRLKTKMNPGNEIYIKLLRKLEAETSPEIRKELSPTPSQIEAGKELSRLTELYLKSLSVLRSFGNHPILFTKLQYENTGITYRRFDIKVLSLLTLYSLLAQVFYICGFCFLSYRCLTGFYRASIIPGSGSESKHGSSTADGLVTAFFTIFFLACCAGAVTSFFASRNLANFLNKWKEFVFLYSKAFPEKRLDFRALECFNYRLFMLSIVICSTYLIWAPFVYRTCLFDFDGKCTRNEREQSFILTGFGCSSVMNLSWEQFKLSLMLRTVAVAFQQIENGLADHKEYNRAIHLKMLRDVFTLTYIVRGQAKLTSQIVGTAQLFVLFYLFGLTIIVWMMAVQSSGGDLSFTLVIVIASIGFVQFGRFGATSLLVEGILIGEKRIVEQVASLKPNSLMGQIEIQIFLNVLTKRPSEFVLNDFITYKRSLFLAIMGNCTSYLIAFQQLLDVSNSDPSAVPQILGSNASLTPASP